MQFFNYLIVISIYTILLYIAFRYIKHRRKRNAPVAINWTEHANNIYTSFHKKMPINAGDIVFVGTSLTAGFPMHEIFEDRRIKNRGIGSNQLKHIIARIDQIAQGKPGKLFLEAGINDLDNKMPILDVITGIIAIVGKIQSCSPDTIIYIQSLFPTSGSSAWLNEHVVELNNDLQSYCKMKGINYIDLHSSFTKDEQLNPEYTYDGIHLTIEGYHLWANRIAGLLI